MVDLLEHYGAASSPRHAARAVLVNGDLSLAIPRWPGDAALQHRAEVHAPRAAHLGGYPVNDQRGAPSARPMIAVKVILAIRHVAEWIRLSTYHRARIFLFPTAWRPGSCAAATHYTPRNRPEARRGAK